jgi:hypothetical protein
MPPVVHGHSPVLGGPSSFLAGLPCSQAHRGVHIGRWGRRPTIDPTFTGRYVHEAAGLDKDALNRSMKMSVPTMGPSTNVKQWKRKFLTFLSLKAGYLIPQLAIRESGVWMDVQAQNYAYALLLHAANENKRADQAVKLVSATRPDCAIAAWNILCERLDGRSFFRFLSHPDNLMLR